MTAEQAQHWVFVLRKPPYGSHWAQACLDFLLTAATFEQETALLFLEDGLYQLVREQQGEACGLKDLSRLLPALELYDVRELLALREDLEMRNLRQEDLLLPVTIIDRAEARARLAAASQVMCY